MILYTHVRIQRGGGSGTTPPPEICQRWGLVWMFGRKERGPKVVLSYYHYFLARFARSPAAYISKNLKNPNQFHAQRTWNGHPLSQHIIHIQLMIPGFHKSAFCLNLHDFGPFKTTPISTLPPPPNYQLTKRNHVKCAFCVEKTPGKVIFTKAIVWKHFND